ncbi:MAG TPA: carboxymuconolactone decarboxylase family protein [Acidimicrobiales bacterium]|nr:carboxymuconolactone decarboxylase family protein [Acidimicrobiales bacterium]
MPMRRIRPTSPRLAPLEVTEMDEEARALLGDEPLNIFRTLARHPKLVKRWLVFGNHVLAKSTLPARERELAILRVGWRCGAEYEFGQHTVIGRQSGLTDDEIAALTRELADGGWSDDDRTLLVAVDELHDDQCITDQTWAALSQRWSEEQLLDLLFTVGQYTLVSMALNSLGVPLDEGVPGFPDQA